MRASTRNRCVMVCGPCETYSANGEPLRLARFKDEQHREVEQALRLARHLRSQLRVALKLVLLDEREAGGVQRAPVICDGVTLRAQAILHAITLEVRFLAGLGHRRVVYREEQSPAGFQEDVKVLVHRAQMRQVLADESAQHSIESLGSKG